MTLLEPEIRGESDGNSRTIFLIFSEYICNVCCDPSLELPPSDSSNVGPKHTFYWRIASNSCGTILVYSSYMKLLIRIILSAYKDKLTALLENLFNCEE